MVWIFLFFLFFYFTCFIPHQNSVRSSHIAKIKDILCDYITNLCNVDSYIASWRLHTIDYELQRQVVHHNFKHTPCATEVAQWGSWPLLLLPFSPLIWVFCHPPPWCCFCQIKSRSHSSAHTGPWFFLVMQLIKIPYNGGSKLARYISSYRRCQEDVRPADMLMCIFIEQVRVWVLLIEYKCLLCIT